MRKHRDLLQFNSPGNRCWAFPLVKKARQAAFFFYLVIILLVLPAPVLLLVFNQSLDSLDAFMVLGFWYFYYGGNLAVIGMINHTQQKGELFGLTNLNDLDY